MAAAEPAAQAPITDEELIEPIADEELIERIISEDEAAFALLYDRYFPRVFNFVKRRLHNRADTEETVQEVFVNVFSSIASYRGEAPFAAWVLGLTRRVIASRFKKKQHPTVPLDDAENLDRIDPLMPGPQREPTPLENYECRERIARIEDTAARHLSSEQRQLFELHHLRHQSIHDIANQLARSEDAVKSNLYRARKVLLSR